MANAGVDEAAVWGTVYKNLTTRLAGLEENPDAPGGYDFWLTAPGVVMRMMTHDLVGTQVLDVDMPDQFTDGLKFAPADRPETYPDQMMLNAFGNDETTILYFSSRTGDPIDITPNIQDLVPDYAHLWGQIVGVVDDPTTAADEGNPLSAKALPTITSIGETDLVDGSGDIVFHLDPYEILRLEFTIGDTGIDMTGDDQHFSDAIDAADTLSGTQGDDVIAGYWGNDNLSGNSGADDLYGGQGDDHLYGGAGNDTLQGGVGDDTLVSGTGNDILIADAGNDQIVIQGDLAHVIVNVQGDTVIEGFDSAAGHTLSFLQEYATADDVMAHSVAVGADLVFLHEAGGSTTLLGAADQLPVLADHLSDFMADSPVADIVEDLLAPEPDGSIAPDPTDVEAPVEHVLLEQLLSSGDSTEISSFLAGLSPE